MARTWSYTPSAYNKRPWVYYESITALYSASKLNVPQEITPIIKKKVLNFRWKIKRDKIKRAGLYQDREKGGMRMAYVEIMTEALRLAWIPRLLTPDIGNWKTIPDYYLRKTGGLNFLLRCNYDVKCIDGLSLFYKDILTFSPNWSL